MNDRGEQHLSEEPWWEQPRYRTLFAVCDAFQNEGPPVGPAHTGEACARFAVFWMLRGLAHVLEEIATRTRAREPCSTTVRLYERGPGRVVVELDVLPAPACVGSPGEQHG